MIWRFELGPWDGRTLGVHDDCLVPMVLDAGYQGEMASYRLHRKIDPAEFVFRYEGTT